jgi:RNA polymerase sigma-70 factor (sigma-E family)
MNARTPRASLSLPAPAVEPLDEREALLARAFADHHDRLVRLAILLGAGPEAEDLVSEAFYRVYRSWRRIRDPGSLLPYLRATLANLVRMEARHQAVVSRCATPPAGEPPSAETWVELREDQREVAAALAGLPPRQRQALVLRYWLDLREADVAAAMGISSGAVKTHVSRGMAALHRALEGSR